MQKRLRFRKSSESSSDWKKHPEYVTSEAFAHMYEAQFDSIRYGEMKKYFPGALKSFEKMMKEGAG